MANVELFWGPAFCQNCLNPRQASGLPAVAKAWCLLDMEHEAQHRSIRTFLRCRNPSLWHYGFYIAAIALVFGFPLWDGWPQAISTSHVLTMWIFHGIFFTVSGPDECATKLWLSKYIRTTILIGWGHDKYIFSYIIIIISYHADKQSFTYHQVKSWGLKMSQWS